MKPLKYRGFLFWGRIKNDVPPAILNNIAGHGFYNKSKFDFEKLLDDLDNIKTNFESYILGFSSNDRLRGEFGPLMMAILLFIMTFIDIKYPLFFFTLNHFLDVKDPEPTDFYLGMQKLGWVVMPLIGIFLMIASIS